MDRQSRRDNGGSLWWADGLLEQSPSHVDVEVGQGWMVLATEGAFGAIRREFGSLVRETAVERRLDRDGKATKRHYFSVECLR